VDINGGGEILALFVAQKIRRYPIDFGVGTLMRRVHNEEAIRLGLDFLVGLRYRGIGEMEFKKGARPAVRG